MSYLSTPQYSILVCGGGSCGCRGLRCLWVSNVTPRTEILAAVLRVLTDTVFILVSCTVYLHRASFFGGVCVNAVSCTYTSGHRGIRTCHLLYWYFAGAALLLLARQRLTRATPDSNSMGREAACSSSSR